MQNVIQMKKQPTRMFNESNVVYLFLFMRTARIEVKKFSSSRATPVTVLNKHSLRGDKDGC